MKITIDLEADIEDMPIEHVESVVKQLLRDALGEFISVRENVSSYVLKRYSYLENHAIEKKVNEVDQRIKIARNLKIGIFDMAVYVEEKNESDNR